MSASAMQRYKITFSGRLKADVTIPDAELALSKLYRTSRANVAPLLKHVGKTIILANNLMGDQAAYIAARFSEAGLLVEILITDPTENRSCVESADKNTSPKETAAPDLRTHVPICETNAIDPANVEKIKASSTTQSANSYQEFVIPLDNRSDGPFATGDRNENTHIDLTATPVHTPTFQERNNLDTFTPTEKAKGTEQGENRADRTVRLPDQNIPPKSYSERDTPESNTPEFIEYISNFATFFFIVVLVLFLPRCVDRCTKDPLSKEDRARYEKMSPAQKDFVWGQTHKNKDGTPQKW